MTFLIYPFAALAEIAGCFAFWAWLKLDRSPLWLLSGLVSLALFAWLLTLVPSEAAGRAYAAYGGVHIAASLIWLWVIEGAKAGSVRSHGRCDLPGGCCGDPLAFQRLRGFPSKARMPACGISVYT
jgi:small multidrug resistance family-3 protein